VLVLRKRPAELEGRHSLRGNIIRGVGGGGGLSTFHLTAEGGSSVGYFIRRGEEAIRPAASGNAFWYREADGWTSSIPSQKRKEKSHSRAGCI